MSTRGSTLTEVLIALGILCVALLGTAQALSVGLTAMSDARVQTMTALLAAARLEQLRGLTFAFDAEGRRITDLTTDLSTEPPSHTGRGLSPAGRDSLAESVAGYVDYLDARGRLVRGGPSPPPNATFVRRWSVDAPDSGDLLVIQVLVRPMLADSRATGDRMTPGETRLVTALARIQR